MKKKAAYVLCGVLMIIGLSLIIYSSGAYDNPKKRSGVLTECVDHKRVKVHHHIKLHISYFGKPYLFPKGIGLEERCDHPIQVHDEASRQIHIHYHSAYPFTLGDFFTTWGVIFNKTQFGATMAGRAYDITMKVNGKPNQDYERYVLKDQDLIELTIFKK